MFVHSEIRGPDPVVLYFDRVTEGFASGSKWKVCTSFVQPSKREICLEFSYKLQNHCCNVFMTVAQR